MIIHIVRSIQNPKAWKVWVSGDVGYPGYLRQGHAWRTRNGAIKSARRYAPDCTAFSVDE